MVVFISYLM